MHLQVYNQIVMLASIAKQDQTVDLLYNHLIQQKTLETFVHKDHIA